MGQGFLRCIVIKAAQVLEGGSIAELILVLQEESKAREREGAMSTSEQKNEDRCQKPKSHLDGDQITTFINQSNDRSVLVSTE